MTRFKIITILTLLIAIISIAIYYASIGKNEYVVDGVFDARENFSNQDTVPLDGNWEFYWEQLLEPGDFKSSDLPESISILVPGKWNPAIGISERGYGTYRLTLKNLDIGKEYGLSKRNIRIASKIYIEDRIVFQDGIPSDNTEIEAMGNEPKTIHFVPTAETVEMIIQVSNFKYYRGGIVESISFGAYDAIEREQRLQLVFEVIISTYLLVITITLAILVIFFPEFRNKKVGSYFMPLTVLAFAVVNGSLGQRIIKFLFNEMTTETLIRIEYVAVGILIMSLTISIHLIEKKLMSSWLTGIISSLYLIITVAVILTDMSNPLIWNLVTFVTLVILPVEFLIVLFRFIWDDGLNIEREEHMLLLVILFLVNLYNVDVLIFTLGYKSNLNFAFLSAGVFGIVWFMLIIYRYSLTIKRNSEISIKLMESYYDIEKNATTAKCSEMAFLQAQIKPHFLFNSLSSIIGLCTHNPKRAQALLINLSLYLKKLFEIETETEYVHLESEMDLIKTYVSIEAERFENRFEFFMNVSEEINEVRIIPLLIQPLVENAIKHGALKRESNGFVKLSVSMEKPYLSVSIEDNGQGMSDRQIESIVKNERSTGKRRQGVGIRNIAERLMFYYGEELHFAKASEGGTLVWFKIMIEEEVDESDSNSYR